MPVTQERMATAEVPAVAATSRPAKILVVDDEQKNRLLLQLMLGNDGHTVLLAANGREAVDVFEREQPDMVLMDVMMPVMDGYEATRQIKARTGERFVPVIFLTAISDAKELAQCIVCGGDDFLSKPFHQVILQAKIRALARIRQLYATIKAQKDALDVHQKRLQREHEVAEMVFANVVRSDGLQVTNIKYLLSPMALFNGDVLLASPKPSGGLYVALGDFTGHGLSAAIGAMPVADIFYDMTAKGFPIGEIVTAINQKLKTILPTGLFFAACFLELHVTEGALAIWNGGLPDVLVYRHRTQTLERLPSQHLPLSVVDNDHLDSSLEIHQVTPGDCIYLYSDGVIEARNPDGEMFGQQRLEACFAPPHDPNTLFETIRAHLEAFRAGELQSDDITLIEVTCASASSDDGPARAATCQPTRPPMPWRMALELQPDALRLGDPLPQIIQTLVEVQGLHEHRTPLYTIVTELFSNALEHGLLRLDSRLKESPQGFMAYYAARQKALAEVEEGCITIDLVHTPHTQGGTLLIRIEDDGPGFDYHHYMNAQPLEGNVALSGRGIPLVRSLCQELTYHDNGNRVEAIYVWH